MLLKLMLLLVLKGLCNDWFYDILFNFIYNIKQAHTQMCGTQRHITFILGHFLIFWHFGFFLTILIFGHFWFWGTFDFGALLILGHFWFWNTFYYGELLFLGHFLFWGTFNFGALLILGHFWLKLGCRFNLCWVEKFSQF